MKPLDQHRTRPTVILQMIVGRKGGPHQDKRRKEATRPKHRTNPVHDRDADA